mgnify:CR=1 FL=1
MAGLLENVDMRTRLAGSNRLELLLFRMSGRQRYGINVFKVREVLECPPLRRVPTAHPAIRGVATIRGRTLPIIDLGKMLGMRATTDMTRLPGLEPHGEAVLEEAEQIGVPVEKRHRWRSSHAHDGPVPTGRIVRALGSAALLRRR